MRSGRDHGPGRGREHSMTRRLGGLLTAGEAIAWTCVQAIAGTVTD